VANSITMFDRVRKSGDTMTGDLTMAAGSKVDGIDVSEIHPAKIKTGTYIGDGYDYQDIDIGVNLAAKANVYVIIRGPGIVREAIHRIEYGQGDLTMFFAGHNDAAHLITSFTSTGFRVGYDDWVNTYDLQYRYIAFWEE